MRDIYCLLIFGVLVGAWTCCSAFAGTSAEDERRISIGSKLFPSLVSVDQGLANKLSPQTKSIHLVFLYTDHPEKARNYAVALANRLKTIRKHPLVAEAMPLSQILDHQQPPLVSAVFIAERLSDHRLQQLLDVTAARHVLSFSPFEGDVARGVVAGLHISSRIRPYINMNAAKQAGIEFHPMFLKLAHKYE